MEAKILKQEMKWKLKFSSNSEYIVTVTKLFDQDDFLDSQVSLYETATGKKLWKVEGSNPEFSSDDKHIAIEFSESGAYVSLYETATGKKLCKVKGMEPRFTSDDKYLTILSDGGVSYYETKTGKVGKNNSGFKFNFSEELLRTEHRPVEFSPDGKYLIIKYKSDHGSFFYLDEIKTGKRLMKIQGENPKFSLDSKYIVTELFDPKDFPDINIFLYETTTGKKLWKVTEQKKIQLNVDKIVNCPLSI